MMRNIWASVTVALALAVPGLPALAAERVSLGYGRLVTNDLFGDGRDRWQTGSAQSSRLRGAGWNGVLPDRPGALLEYRLGFQLTAPANLRIASGVDRPLAGSVSAGLHTHFTYGGAEVSLGADLVVTGPQTGLIDLQTALHDGFGEPPARPAIKARQIGNGLHPTFVGETGQPLRLGPARLRPFAEARIGAETLMRIGADLSLGAIGDRALRVRDTVTGHRYAAIRNRATGASLVLGGDAALMESSIFLPESRGLDLRSPRTRLRAGLHHQGRRHALFYGLTWLGPEFEAQSQGQLLGSLRLHFAF